MNYQAALKDFKKVQKNLALLKSSDEITYDNSRIMLETGVISMLIIRHYTGPIKEHGEIWGNHLVAIPKISLNNHVRLEKMVALVDKIVDDIQSRSDADAESRKESTNIVHHDDEGKPLTLEQLISDFNSLQRTNRLSGRTLMETSHLFEQAKGKLAETNQRLLEAESDKARLHHEIQRLNQKLETEKFWLADQDMTAKKFENDRRTDLETQKQARRDDIARLESTIDSLKDNRKILAEEMTRAEGNWSTTKKDSQMNLPDTTDSAKKELSKQYNPKYQKILITLGFVFAVYIWFTLERVFYVKLSHGIFWGGVVGLVGIFALVILAKKDEIKNKILDLIIGLIIAFLSWLSTLN